MNREEKLYQIIFKTILNDINKQQQIHQQQQQQNNSSNINNDDDNDENVFSQLSEKIINSIDNDIITLLQRIITSNRDIWSWEHFFNYLLNNNNSSNNNIINNSDNNNIFNNNNSNNKIFILKLNKDLQIELISWFLTILRCINNDNSPSDNIIIPIKYLNSFIIKSYIENKEGYLIYKSDYLFSFIVDSILSDISLLIDTNYSDNSNNNSNSYDNNNNQQIKDDEEGSIGLYYPFNIYYGKEFNKTLDETINQLNQNYIQREKEEKKYQNENKMKVDDQDQIDNEDDNQLDNYYSDSIRELIKLGFSNNKLNSIMGSSDIKDYDGNPYRYQSLKQKKSTVTSESELLDNVQLDGMKDLLIDDIVFNNKDQLQEQNQTELHLQDWSVQFQSLIPDFNNMDLDIGSMFKNSINYRPELVVYNNNNLNGEEDNIISPIEQLSQKESSAKTTTTTTTNTTEVTTRKLENEEITPIIQIKEFIRNDNNNSNLKQLLEPLLLVSDIGEALKLLEADTYSEDQFIQFMSTIISLDFSFLSLSKFFSALLLPKALDVKNKSERGFLDLLGNCFKQHHTSFINSFMVPLIVRNEEFLPPQKEIIIKLLQIKEIDNSVKVQFVSSLLTSIQKNHQFIWNESIVWIFTTLIQLKLIFNEKIFTDLFEVLSIGSKSLSKNQKFANLILSIISSYQKNIKEFVPKIEQLLLNMQINVKGSLNLLEKIKHA